MKIQYISNHSVLEYDEVLLLTELGYDVHANGVYRDPRGAHTLPRPGIPGAKFDQKFFDLTARHPQTNLPPELIEPYDVIIFMSGLNEKLLISNWDNIKHKRVIWRGIGQNTSATEPLLKKYRSEGLELVRYSPKEEGYRGYAGADAMIRFYKDPEVFDGWVGDTDQVMTLAQSLKVRETFLHYREIMGTLTGFNSKVYGSGNHELGKFNGGEISFEAMLDTMRHARVFVYGGTWPACYTLSIIEAMMMGMPVVAIGKSIAHLPQYEQLDFYEVDEIIEHRVNGFIGNSINEMREYVQKLIIDYDMAKEVSQKARSRAIELFGKSHIAKQWDSLLKGGD